MMDTPGGGWTETVLRLKLMERLVFSCAATVHNPRATPTPSTQTRFQLCPLDLGVSSYQLDTAERGFSYIHAPMDMRMNEDDMFTAATVVNEYSEAELFELSRRRRRALGVNV